MQEVETSRRFLHFASLSEALSLRTSNHNGLLSLEAGTSRCARWPSKVILLRGNYPAVGLEPTVDRQKEDGCCPLSPSWSGLALIRLARAYPLECGGLKDPKLIQARSGLVQRLGKTLVSRRSRQKREHPQLVVGIKRLLAAFVALKTSQPA